MVPVGTGFLLGVIKHVLKLIVVVVASLGMYQKTMNYTGVGQSGNTVVST